MDAIASPPETFRLPYATYWQEEGRQVACSQLRATSLFAIGLMIAFMALDVWAHPASARIFVGLRAVNIALLTAILLRFRFSHPRQSELVLCLSVGATILTMIYVTGGPRSNYYVGLIILFVGMPVLQPLRARHAAFVSGFFCAGFLLQPFALGVPFVFGDFVIPLVFLLSGAVESIVSCRLLSDARIRDYSQRRELQRARDHLKKLDEAKSRFSANVHHELRTPLTLILAPLDALRAGDYGPLPESIEGALETMQANGKRLHRMINNLLDLSKLESRQYDIHRRPLRLERLARDLVTGARALAERKGIDLSLEGFSDLPVVHADSEAIEKVLANLVGNALKFTEPGGSIRVRAVPAPGGISLTVADTGVGIPPDQLEGIFDRFAQVDSSVTRRHEGTGIGLSLAREMVELHGGRIWAESPGEGHGTTMHVWLPIGEPDASSESESEVLLSDEAGGIGLRRSLETVEAEGRADEGDVSRPDSLLEMKRTVVRFENDRQAEEIAARNRALPDGTPEVLIAEDNPDMRSLLALLVGREYRVRAARNGREALEALRDRMPDLVLSDVMMPELSGVELCRTIKGDPELKAVPVVLVTSKAEREMKIEGLELGADDYVTKPFHPRELMARVRSLVRVRALQQELQMRNRALERALSELKQAEVQLVQSERLAAVGELAAGIAHEVNNPVNFALNAVRALATTTGELRDIAARAAELDSRDPVRLASQLEAFRKLRDKVGADDLADTLCELTEIIGEGLRRTHSLVADLRDFAAPGRRGEARVDVDVERGLRSTLQLLKHRLADRRATVSLDVQPDLPPIPADPGALNQVFLNLIKNAAEAFGPEGGNIRIRVEHGPELVRILVEDDGPGIPESVRPHLFEPFFTTKEAGEGTGLGLSISRQIVRSFGGCLDLAESGERGARFVVDLPRGPRSEPAASE